MAAWYVWQLVRERQVGQPPSRGRDSSLFVVEVGEEVLLELLERVCNGTTCVVAVVLRQRFGGGFDCVDVVGHSSVIGSQSVDDRPERRVHLLELVEELSVFGVVVQVDELAVAQAADLELPERRVALQLLELLVQLLCCEPVEDGRREPLDAREFAADVCVDGEERLMEPAPARVSGRSSKTATVMLLAPAERMRAARRPDREPSAPHPG